MLETRGAGAAVHEQYEALLRRLSDGPGLLASFDGEEPGPGGRSWKQTFARFEPGKDPFARMCFETVDDPQRIVRLEAFRSRPQASAQTLYKQDEELGWLALSGFPADPELPTLGAVLDDAPKVRVIRYRPHRRCTMRVETDSGCYFVKVFPEHGEGERLHLEAQQLWSASAAGELGFRAAEPVRWDHERRALWQRRVPGEPAVPALFGAKGAELARRMGQAAASLGCSSLKPTETFDSAVQMARSVRYGAEISERVPKLRPQVDDLLHALAQIHEQTAARQRLQPIHGGLHAHQWLVDGQALALVDFDRFSMGDAELDAATFVAELDFERGTEVPVEVLAREFLDGYESVNGQLNASLMAAYRAHKRLAKTLRTTRSLRLDSGERAGRHLRRAVDALNAR